MRSTLLIGALVASAFGETITFANTTFTDHIPVGSTWPISYSVGNGEPVEISFGNSTFSFKIVDAVAAPGTLPWSVVIPTGVVAGKYQLSLLQDSTTSATSSPEFDLILPTEDNPPTPTSAPPSDLTPISTTTTITAIFITHPPSVSNNTTAHPINNNSNAPSPSSSPDQTYIYFNSTLSSYQTSSCACTQLPGTITALTSVTYWDAECGCTRTIVDAPFTKTIVTGTPVAALAEGDGTNMTMTTTTVGTMNVSTSASTHPTPGDLTDDTAVAASTNASASRSSSSSSSSSSVPTFTGAAAKPVVGSRDGGGAAAWWAVFAVSVWFGLASGCVMV